MTVAKADDPRCYVGDVVEATETEDGLAIKGRFDLDTAFGKSAYRNTKGRRVLGLSIVPIVARGANDRTLVRRCNAGVRADQGGWCRPAVVQVTTNTTYTPPSAAVISDLILGV